jgi:hypothetical protein
VLPLSQLLGASALALPLSPVPEPLAPLLDVAAAVHAVDPSRAPAPATTPAATEAPR